MIAFSFASAMPRREHRGFHELGQPRSHLLQFDQLQKLRRNPENAAAELAPWGPVVTAIVVAFFLRKTAASDREEPMLRLAPLYAYIPASDIARARKFYEEVVGLVPHMELAGGVVYQFAHHTACFLYPSPNAGTSKASQAFWQVTDVEREVAELKARGVRFEEYDVPGMETRDSIVVAGGAKSAWFKDTEGNIMAVVQSL
jgi:predicted enzyme related to lactoylglutathione lyase